MRFSVHRFAAAAAAGVGLLSACAGAQAANLIQNGSFESPIVGAGGYAIVGAGNSFTGWDVVGVGNVAPISGTFSGFGATLNAQDGAQWIDMTGATTTGAGIQQSVSTAPGQVYRLSFWVGNIASGGSTSKIDVKVDGATLFSATNSTLTPGAFVWERFSTTFTATGSTTTLAFFNGDPSGDDNNGLDNISLAAAVPEPATWALMILGFGGAGAVVRSRRRSALTA